MIEKEITIAKVSHRFFDGGKLSLFFIVDDEKFIRTDEVWKKWWKAKKKKRSNVCKACAETVKCARLKIVLGLKWKYSQIEVSTFSLFYFDVYSSHILKHNMEKIPCNVG